jgi:hypothetical protein
VPDASDPAASVAYRPLGSSIWRNGHDLWRDGRDHSRVPERGREYRGSIVGLQPGTEYEIELRLNSGGQTTRLVETTWREEFPIAKTIGLRRTSTDALEILESGSPTGYILYAAGNADRATIDVAGGAEYNIVIDASYVIVRGLDLKNARRHAIFLRPRAHHVVIEDNDISGWGRIADDGFGLDGDSAVSNEEVQAGQGRKPAPSVKSIVIQNNRMHHPRSNSNNWRQFREMYRSPHPAGPQAITLWDTGGNHVIRYNEIYSDEQHYFNDGIGGGDNFSSFGGPGADSDIYGNKVSHCWDDAIESEGGNANVRIWENFLDMTYVMIGATPTVLGPLYVFRNVSYRARYSPQNDFNSGVFLKSQSKVMRDQFWGTGRVYVYHNTLYRTSMREGTITGITGFGAKLQGYVSRNNIFDVTKAAFEGFEEEAANDFDYDLYPTRPVGGGHEHYGIIAEPRYASAGQMALEEGTPGHDDGVVIPNFNDGFTGKAPDRGAQERGGPILRFGLMRPW